MAISLRQAITEVVTLAWDIPPARTHRQACGKPRNLSVLSGWSDAVLAFKDSKIAEHHTGLRVCNGRESNSCSLCCSEFSRGL